MYNVKITTRKVKAKINLKTFELKYNLKISIT